ncbi:hypothetical protein MYP_2097 [Sporocytophaga myxococcoides]|uniref:Uncharacterized protein n=1 Tax=Sporocytophaga myxococcoides TaxID=153721 RepID=A0A098LEM6_9BACT|nr:hypothetical protein [Sporocytophaga myxococcoides]GAL84869.1 hypothetical protein MYP_2097 [Sporocytophaga myxococcoides]
MRTFSKLEKSIIKKIISLSKKGQTMISPELFLENQLNSSSQLYVIEGKSIPTISDEGVWNFSKIEITGKPEDVYKDFYELPQRFLLISEFIDYLLKEEYLMIQGTRLPSSFYLNKIANIPEDETGIAELDLKITPTIKLFLDKYTHYYAPTDALINLSQNNFYTYSRQSNFRKRILSIPTAAMYLFGTRINHWLKKTRLLNQQSIKLNPIHGIHYSNMRSSEIEFETDQIYLSLLED